jgi:hypothetical protein
MKLNQYLFSALLLMGLPAIAAADAPQNYWGMGIDGLDVEGVTPRGLELFPTEQDMNGFNLRYGLWFPFDVLGIEIRVGSVGEETGTLVGDPEVRYIFGMGKANIPFEKANLYVMLGVSKTNYDVEGDEESGEDAVGGFGIELLANETTGLTIEYLKYGMDDDDAEGRVMTIGFNHRFELPGFR